LIKTLRIYDPQNNFALLDEILLEQVKVYSHNSQVKRNHISYLQNGFKIYFFRRMNKIEKPGSTKLVLFSYDISKRAKEV
jgi:hypothetical protein